MDSTCFIAPGQNTPFAQDFSDRLLANVIAVDDLHVVSVSVTDCAGVAGQQLCDSPVLEVCMSTKADLVSASLKYELNIFNTSSVDCGDGVRQRSAVHGYRTVFWNGYDTSSLGAGPRVAEYRSSDQPDNRYYIYVPIMQQGGSSGVSGDWPQWQYDLAEKPVDICISIRGRDMIGMGFTSNTVIISRDAISRAIAEHHAITHKPGKGVTGCSSHLFMPAT
jgi:hypothetical protein